jgi:phage terminase small subunit
MSNLPKPSALKILQGTDRADRRNPAEPKPPVGAVPPPWLPRNGPARSAWRRLAPALTATRVLTVADSEALALACIALADFLEARADANGWRRADAAWKRYSGMLVQFGMTPSARTRVAAVPAVERDPLAEWITRGTSAAPPPPPPARQKRTIPTTPPADALEAWQRGDRPEEPA